jgi:hypothetical protein
MNRYLTYLWLVLWAAALACRAATAAEPEAAAEAPAKDRFIRVTRDAKGEPLALQTSVVSYSSADGARPGLVVDLVGAVHVADREYYEALNKRFEAYESVLYELVAPEGTRVPKGGENKPANNPVHAMQKGMQAMLELEYQLERIDYTKQNFVHADLSPEEFAKSMKDRGEGVVQMILRMLGQAAAAEGERPAKAPQVDLLTILFSPDRAYYLKRMMADQFEDLEASLVVFEGADGSTIISERNKRAMGVLSKQIDGGQKRIAIFYGAGHLSDMERRLGEQFGLKRTNEEWLTAWDLTRKKPR